MEAANPSTSSDPDQHTSSGPSSGPARLFTDLQQQVDATTKLFGALTAAIASLAVVVKLVVPDDNLANLIAGGCGLVIVAALGAWAYRARVARPAPDAPRRILRGLPPFGQLGSLPERQQDVDLLVEAVSSSAFRFGVLFGKFGCGKTSLLRAGLLPRLGAAGPVAVHVPSIGADPLAATAHALRKTLVQGTSRDPAEYAGVDSRDLLRKLESERKQSVVLIYDQFEDFFSLACADENRRTAFMRWVGDCIQDDGLHAGFLFAVRDDLSKRMGDFEPFVPEARSAAHRYELRDFRPDQAEKVLHLAVERREAKFKPDLIEAIVDGLTGEGAVRPALLQIVATRLRDQGVTTVREYRALGQATGVLEAYVFEKVHDSADSGSACAIMTLLASGDAHQAVPAHGLDRIVRAVQEAAGPGEQPREHHVVEVLQELASARLVLAKGDGTYRLAHRYLSGPVRRAVTPRPLVVQQADELLEQYAAVYASDGCTRVPRRELQQIRRHATPALQHSEPAHTLLKKSEAAIRLSLAGRVGAALAVVLVVLAFATGVVRTRPAWEPVVEFTLFDPQLQSETLPKAVAFHPGSKMLVMASHGPSGGLFALEFWNGILSFTNRIVGPTPKELPETGGTAYTALAFSPSGRNMVSGGTDGTIRIWIPGTWTNHTLANPALVGEAPACQNKAIVFLGFNRAGDRLVSAAECGLLQVWDVPRGIPLASRHVPFALGSQFVRLSPDGTHVAALRPREGLEDVSAIYVWRLAGGEFRDVYPEPIEPEPAVLLGLAFDTRNRLVVAAHDSNRFELRIYDHAQAPSYTVDPLYGAEADDDSWTIISSDGRVVGVADMHDALRIWDRDSSEAALLAASASTGAVLSPDGQALVLSKFPSSALYTNELHLIRVPTRGSR